MLIRNEKLADFKELKGKKFKEIYWTSNNIVFVVRTNKFYKITIRDHWDEVSLSLIEYK